MVLKPKLVSRLRLTIEDEYVENCFNVYFGSKLYLQVNTHINLHKKTYYWFCNKSCKWVQTFSFRDSLYNMFYNSVIELHPPNDFRSFITHLNSLGF